MNTDTIRRAPIGIDITKPIPTDVKKQYPKWTKMTNTVRRDEYVIRRPNAEYGSRTWDLFARGGAQPLGSFQTMRDAKRHADVWSLTDEQSALLREIVACDGEFHPTGTDQRVITEYLVRQGLVEPHGTTIVTGPILVTAYAATETGHRIADRTA